MKLTTNDGIIKVRVVGDSVNLYITEPNTGDCVDMYLDEKEFQDLFDMLNKINEVKKDEK